MRTVSTAGVVTEQLSVSGLPVRVQEALGELAGAAKEGLLALSVGVGLGVLHEIMEAEVCEVVGPKGKHDRDRTAKRHGHEDGSVTLGGRRVAVRRPRVGSAVTSMSWRCRRTGTSPTDPLTEVVLERMLAGVSTRRYARTGEPVGADVEDASRSTSKSAVSRQFVARTRENLIELMSRPLGNLRLAVLMLDGIDLKGRCCVVARGIDTDGVKHPLGLWDGLDRERHRRDDAAGQPRRARPGHRTGRARRARRRQGAPQGRPPRARRPHAGAALPPPQRMS